MSKELKIDKIIFRDKLDYLVKWSLKKEFEPLMVFGAKNVGKTFLLVELFAKKHFSNKYVYVDFETNLELKEKLYGIKNVKEIILLIQDYYQVLIDNTWLIIFDEIQEIPSIRTSLKSFNEGFKNYYKVIACGSYLKNTMMEDNEGFPVGQVETITINPISFKEYLITTDNKCLVNNIVDSLSINKMCVILDSYHNLLIDKLMSFLLIGGFPILLRMYLFDNTHVKNIAAKRNEIYESYLDDLSKYASSNKTIRDKVINLYNYVYKPLINQSNEFILKTYKKTHRTYRFDYILMLLLLSNLVYKVPKLSKIKQKASIVSDIDSNNEFKLYFNDFGLIHNFYQSNNKDFYKFKDIDTNVKKSLVENFVIAELSNKVEINNWTRYYTFKVNSNSYEIDLMIEDINHDLIPIEIKSTKKFNISSLKKYIDIYKPQYAIVFSLKNFNVVEYNKVKIYYIPLYAVGMLNIVDSRLIPFDD